MAKRIYCSMLVNTITGDAWKKHLKDREGAEKRIADGLSADETTTLIDLLDKVRRAARPL